MDRVCGKKGVFIQVGGLLKLVYYFELGTIKNHSMQK